MCKMCAEILKIREFKNIYIYNIYMYIYTYIYSPEEGALSHRNM